ncbi:MAG: hypothetical protein ACTSPE_04505 [Candidatus Thorarchaeota archaeon]
MTIPNLCESCGKEIPPFKPAKTLEDNFAQEEQKRLGICRECFDKRFKIVTRRSSGYGGTIYELEPKPPPRFGLGSKKFTCLKCDWVAWTEEGLAAHMQKRHSG